MSSVPIGADDWVRRERPSSDAKVVARQRLAGVLLRTLFIISLLVVIVRVSMPQTESVWTAYATTGDLIRVTLGFFASLWIAAQLFALPRDDDSHRVWLYLGLAAVPFALICMIGTW